MLDLLITLKAFYAALVILVVLGAIAKIAEWKSMKSLLNAARNVKDAENHNLIKQMKLGYTNAYNLSYGVNNTKVFIEKYMMKNKVCGMSIAFLESLEEKITLLIGIATLAGILFSTYFRKEGIELVFVAGTGIISVLALKLAGELFSSGEMKHQFMIYMEDYFENVLQNRLKNHKRDNGKISPATGKSPVEPRLREANKIREGKLAKEAESIREKVTADVQTAAAHTSAAQTPEELVVEEIIKEFFS